MHLKADTASQVLLQSEPFPMTVVVVEVPHGSPVTF